MSLLGQALSILIVDDSSTIRSFIERSLRKTAFNFNIYTACDGADALDKIGSTEFDIIFIDINMPVVNGIEVMGALNKMGRKTLAIAMSDSLNTRDNELLGNFGTYDFLVKPFTEQDIIDAINTYFLIKMPHKLLLVDGSLTIRRIVAKILEKSIFNLTITEVGDAKAALELARKQFFRIVFADLNMPGMNGIELARQLRAIHEISSVVVMSTDFSPALDKSALSAGACAFLKKPFYSEDVDTILHYVFDLPHAQFSKSVKLFASIL